MDKSYDGKIIPCFAYARPEKLDAVEFLRRRMHKDDSVLILDVRPHSEFLEEHLKNSVNVCLSNFLLRRVLCGSSCEVEMGRIFPDRRSLIRVKDFATNLCSRTIVAYDGGSQNLSTESGIEVYTALDLIRRNLIKGLNFSPGNITSQYIEGGFKALKDAYISHLDGKAALSPDTIIYRGGESGSESSTGAKMPLSTPKYRLKISPIAPAPGQLKVKTSLNPRGHRCRKISFSPASPCAVCKLPECATGSELEFPDLHRLSSKSFSDPLHIKALSRSSSCSTPDDTFSASIVLPYLMIGSDEIFQSKDAIPLLKHLKVSHILNMTLEKENENITSSGLFVTRSFGVEDRVDSEVDNILHDVVNYIHSVHLQSNENVIFVHCKAGRSRSATVAIAYLIKYANMSLTSAYEFVNTARPGISPNLGFFVSLQEFEKKILSLRGTSSDR